MHPQDNFTKFVPTVAIGGGKCTGSGPIGHADVTITGGDTMGQVIMAGTGDLSTKCTFIMTDGKLHGSDVTTAIDNFHFLEKNGGAVWMADPIGVTNISGGSIYGCTAELGGAIYMEGGTFTLSGTGKISGNTAKKTADAGTGMGGGVYLPGGDFTMIGGTIEGNHADYCGGGIYLTKSPTLTKDIISVNTAPATAAAWLWKAATRRKSP